MIDLNRIGSGRKLIKHLISETSNKSSPWSKQSQIKKISSLKNPHTVKSRSSNKY